MCLAKYIQEICFTEIERGNSREFCGVKIFHISNDFYNSGVYATLLEGHRQHGMDSHFFVSMPKDVPERQTPHVVEAHCFCRGDRYFYLNKQKKVYRAFRPILEREKPDLLHGYFLFSAGISCLWAKQEYGIPYVVTVQNTDIHVIFRYFVHLRGLGRKILSEASAVFFPSPAYRSFALTHMVRPEGRTALEEKSYVMPFALNPFWTAHAQSNRQFPHDGAVRLLTVGRVERDKNQAGVLKAAELLAQSGMDVELTAVGAVVDETVEKKLTASPLVRRVPQIPKEELIREYRRADIFVMPSFHESFGLVYAEALSQGVPVLYTAGQGFDGQFPEGTVGFHVRAEDPMDIADGVRQILSDYPLIQSRCTKAAERFAQDRICGEAEHVYEQILRNANVAER